MKRSTKKKMSRKTHLFIIDSITTAAFIGFVFSVFKIYFESWEIDTTIAFILSGIWLLLYGVAWGAFDSKDGDNNVVDR